MKHVTINRILIAFTLIYFPIAVLGDSGSYWEAAKTFLFLAAVMMIGADEMGNFIKSKSLSNGHN